MTRVDIYMFIYVPATCGNLISLCPALTHICTYSVFYFSVSHSFPHSFTYTAQAGGSYPCGWRIIFGKGVFLVLALLPAGFKAFSLQTRHTSSPLVFRGMKKHIKKFSTEREKQCGLERCCLAWKTKCYVKKMDANKSRSLLDEENYKSLWASSETVRRIFWLLELHDMTLHSDVSRWWH